MKRVKYLSDLPPDCFAWIIPFLPTYSDFMSLMLSKRGLYEHIVRICPHSCRYITFKMKCPPNSKNLLHVHSLEFIEKENSHQKSFFFQEYFPNLMNFNFISTSKNVLFILSPLNDLLFLVELYAEINSKVVVIQNFPKLERATIVSNNFSFDDDCRYISHTHLNSQVGLENIPKLRYLHIKSFSINQPQGLEKLEELILENTILFDPNFFDSKIEGKSIWPNLRILRVFQENNIRKIENLPKLEELEYSDDCFHEECTHNRFFEVHVTQLKNLDSLRKIIVRGNFKKNDLQRIEKLKNLKYIDLSGCILRQISETPKLREIVLRNHSFLEMIDEEILYKMKSIMLMDSEMKYSIVDINKCENLERLVHIGFDCRILQLRNQTEFCFLDLSKLQKLRILDVTGGSKRFHVVLGWDIKYRYNSLPNNDYLNFQFPSEETCSNLEELRIVLLCQKVRSVYPFFPYLPTNMKSLKVLYLEIVMNSFYRGPPTELVQKNLDSLNEYENLEEMVVKFLSARFFEGGKVSLSLDKKKNSLRKLEIATDMIQRESVGKIGFNDFSSVSLSGEFRRLESINLVGIDELKLSSPFADLAPELSFLCLSKINNIMISDFSKRQISEASNLDTLVLEDLSEDIVKSVLSDLIIVEHVYHLEIINSFVFSSELQKFRNLHELCLVQSKSGLPEPAIEKLENLETLFIQNCTKSTVVVDDLPNLINLGFLSEAHGGLLFGGSGDYLFEIFCEEGINFEIALKCVACIDGYFKIFSPTDRNFVQLDTYGLLLDCRDEVLNEKQKENRKDYYCWTFVYELSNLPKLKEIYHNHNQSVTLHHAEGFSKTYNGY